MSVVSRSDEAALRRYRPKTETDVFKTIDNRPSGWVGGGEVVEKQNREEKNLWGGFNFRNLF